MIGTGGNGLKYFNTKTEKFSNENGFPDNAIIYKIHIDRQKNLWIVTNNGIFRKSSVNNEVNPYLPDNPEEVLNPNIFLDIVETEGGEIFVGGRNGLYKYDSLSNSFNKKIFENTSPLWITNIQIDSKKNMWFNLNFNQIAKWDTETNEVRIFNVNNGIRTSPYNRRGFFIDDNDELYLSGFDQIYRFETSNQVINKFSPVPVFTKLVINNTEVHVGMELNNQIILDSNIGYQKKIILNNRNKDFTLSYTTTSYLNNKENQYRYILHEYNNDWHVENNQSVHYTNLKPGKYIFKMLSTNNDEY